MRTVFLLLITVFSFSTTLLPFNSSLYLSQTQPWRYFSLPAHPDLTTALIELLLNPPQVTTVLLCLRRAAPPQFQGSDLIADLVDYEGWFYSKSQLFLSLPEEVLASEMIVGVYVNTSTSEGGNVTYQLRTSSGNRPKCPFDCSNVGNCADTGTCVCEEGFTSTDCSLQYVDANDREKMQEVYISGATWRYMKVNVTSASDLFTFKWATLGQILVLVKPPGDYFTQFPSLYEYEDQYISGSPLTVRLDKVGIWTFAVQAVDESGFFVTVTVTQRGNRAKMRLIVGLISAACMLSVLCFFLILLRYRLKRMHANLTKAVPQHSTSLGMSVDLPQPFAAGEQTEGVATCPICLCSIEQHAMVRELNCGHRFHSDCLVLWFESSTVCCVCFRDFAVLAPEKKDFEDTTSQPETQSGYFSFR